MRAQGTSSCVVRDCLENRTHRESPLSNKENALIAQRRASLHHGLLPPEWHVEGLVEALDRPGIPMFLCCLMHHRNVLNSRERPPRAQISKRSLFQSVQSGTDPWPTAPETLASLRQSAKMTAQNRVGCPSRYVQTYQCHYPGSPATRSEDPRV